MTPVLATSAVVADRPSSTPSNPKEDGAISTPSNPKEDAVSKDTLTSTTESRKVTEVQVAMAVLGAIFGLALALVVAGIIYYRRCRKVDGKKIHI